jgi:rod shape-determining protein MreC
MASLNRRLKYFIIIIIIVVLSLVIITVSYRQSELVQGIKAKTVDILKPVQEKFVLLFNPITSFFNSLGDYIKLKDEYLKLQEENSELRRDYSENINLKVENDALRKLLGMELREDHLTITAKVIGYYENKWQSEVILNVGNSDGVLEGMAVINEEGLVGIVAVSGKESCNARLIDDPQTNIGARILSSRKLGVIQGGQDRKVIMNYILNEEVVFKGDIVVTSEYGNFPGEILIGRVSKVFENAGDPYKTIEIEPFVDFKSMEYVLVIKE